MRECEREKEGEGEGGRGRGRERKRKTMGKIKSCYIRGDSFNHSPMAYAYMAVHRELFSLPTECHAFFRLRVT